MTARATDRSVVFLHIPKTAGSTLRDLFRRHYPRPQLYVARAGGGGDLADYVAGRGPEPPRRDGGARVRNIPHVARFMEMPEEQRRELRAFMGHFWFGVHETFERDARYVTMLRHPIDRVLSLYQHRVANHGLEQGLEDYVAAGRDFELDNGQTRRLCGWSTGDLRRDAASDAMLESAKRNLREGIEVLGLTERFDESLLLLAQTLGWRDVGYERKNVSERRPRREQLDAGLLRELERRNGYDLELYEYATRLFAERVPAARGATRWFVLRSRLHTRARPLATKVAGARRQVGRVRRLPRKIASLLR